MTEQGVINIIDKISDKLSVPTSEIINAYAASGVINFWFEIVLFIFAIVGIIISYFVYKYDVYQNKNNRYDNSFSYTKTSIFSTIIIWIITLTNIPFVMFWLNNPRAFAITKLIDRLSYIKK